MNLVAFPRQLPRVEIEDERAEANSQNGRPGEKPAKFLDVPWDSVSAWWVCYLTSPARAPDDSTITQLPERCFMKRVILALALGVSTSGCGTSQSDLIRSMAATAPSPPVTYTISGMVSEVTPTGSTPVDVSP